MRCFVKFYYTKRDCFSASAGFCALEIGISRSLNIEDSMQVFTILTVFSLNFWSASIHSR